MEGFEKDLNLGRHFPTKYKNEKPDCSRNLPILVYGYGHWTNFGPTTRTVSPDYSDRVSLKQDNSPHCCNYVNIMLIKIL